jgi:Ser/Thr protein kinase RdoA (MazF antagonist)
MSAEAILVHGLGPQLVTPDWEAISHSEARAVLARYGLQGAAEATVLWGSPRPQSAAALIGCGDREVLLKRHDLRVRTAAALLLEHRLAAHLRRGGVPIPTVLSTPDGATALSVGDGVYELHERAAGMDLYRDAPSWTGYRSASHARDAGAMLARLHRAAVGFGAPVRKMGPLTDSCGLAAAADPLAALTALVTERPGLAQCLREQAWPEEIGAALAPFAPGAGAALASLPRSWGHGDWHPSNLTWTQDGPDARVAAVLDLGLANRTSPVWDLGTAIERACIDWLAAEGDGSGPARPVRADFKSVDGLLNGYESQRTLTPGERAAMAELLPVVHVAFALSEIEYYGAVLGSSERARTVYRDYLIGHCRWFESPEGAQLLDHLRVWARVGPPGPPGASPESALETDRRNARTAPRAHTQPSGTEPAPPAGADRFPAGARRSRLR